jgi:hypothetical protein
VISRAEGVSCCGCICICLNVVHDSCTSIFVCCIVSILQGVAQSSSITNGPILIVTCTLLVLTVTACCIKLFKVLQIKGNLLRDSGRPVEILAGRVLGRKLVLAQNA